VRGWQPLHDIVVGEKIAVPRRIDCFGTDDSWAVGKVRLLAYFIAEGSLTNGSPGFTNTDAEIVEDFSKQIADLFPSLHIRRHDITYYASGDRGQKNPLIDLLRQVGLMGKLADQKRFPKCVWRWDRDRLRDFVRVLMSCDGTIYSMGGYPRIEFAVASESLAEDLHHAFVRFGRKRIDVGESRSQNRPQWSCTSEKLAGLAKRLVVSTVSPSLGAATSGSCRVRSGRTSGLPRESAAYR
jgi:replicative DNA helicase